MNKAIKIILVISTLFFALYGCSASLKDEQIEEDILRNAVLIRNTYTT
jgi:hypothetical protein